MADDVVQDVLKVLKDVLRLVAADRMTIRRCSAGFQNSTPWRSVVGARGVLWFCVRRRRNPRRGLQTVGTLAALVRSKLDA
jgi:hypothetical protein